MSAAAAAATLPPSIPNSGSLYVAGSSGDGGDDPSRRRLALDPSHGLDANPVIPGEEEEEEEEEKLEQEGVEAVPGTELAEEVAPPSGRRRKWGESIPAGPQQCATCFKVFPSIMSLHGHMRCHPARLRRWGAALVANDKDRADRKRLFICDRCGQVFLTRQSLGGHRASHKGQQGCYEMAKEEREYGQPSSRKARKKRAIRNAAAAAETAVSDANSVLSALFTEQARPPTAAAAPQPLPVPPTTTTGPSTETRQGRRRRKKKRKRNLLSLDLNLIPVNINLPPEISTSEEMDESGNIGGNVSSSSTS